MFNAYGLVKKSKQYSNRVSKVGKILKIIFGMICRRVDLDDSHINRVMSTYYI